ncbi:MAG: stage II sporulation protein R [Eubacterium sp.]|nr:stage II sporulation protein R [Eubacterium sp.]MBR0412830.1 stage II sporulation protein R [Eubacterium sp.]
MKKIFVFVPIFLIFALVATAILPQIEKSENISKNVLRLHILANSDSLIDQELKLKVRDEILKLSSQLYDDCNDIYEAVNVATENRQALQYTAQKTLAFYDCADEVRVSVCKEFFSTREYDSFTLPAGVYNTVKITIGEGKGHNWWCVMFPTVCLTGCTDDFDKSLTPEERKMIETKGYATRFKTVEIYERVKNIVTKDN